MKTFASVPAPYQDMLRQDFRAEVESGQMTIERYKELTGEPYPEKEEAPTE